MRRFALLILLLTACQRAPTALDVSYGQVLVQAMLSAGDSLATVLITTSAPGPENEWLKISERPVSGAKVHLESLHGRVELENAATDDDCIGVPEPLTDSPDLTPGCYAATITGGIQPGARYTLAIDLPNGRQVTGQVTVPFPPSFTAPSAGAQIMNGGIQGNEPTHVRWVDGETVPYLTIRMSIPDQPQCQMQMTAVNVLGAVYVLHVTGTDSITLQRVFAVCRGQHQPVRGAAEIVITAYDSTYAEYIAGGWDGFRTNVKASAGLRGAWGIFAASASARLPVTLVPAP